MKYLVQALMVSEIKARKIGYKLCFMNVMCQSLLYQLYRSVPYKMAAKHICVTLGVKNIKNLKIFNHCPIFVTYFKTQTHQIVYFKVKDGCYQ